MTMGTVGWAVTWEYWRRGTLWLALATAALISACTCLLYAPLLYVTGFHYSDLRPELDSGLMALLLLPPLVLVTASCLGTRRIYTLPVTTSVLVGCTLVNGAVAAVGIFGFVAIVLGRVFGAAWPFLAPACSTVTAYVVLQSLAWQVGRSRGQFMLLLVLFLVFAMPLGVGYLLPRLLEPGNRTGWTGLTISAETVLVCCTTWFLSYLLAVNGVARDRRGDAWSFDWLARGGTLLSGLAGRLRITVSQNTPVRAFRAPYTAQFWYEWHTKGRVVLLFVLAIVVGLWVWLIVGNPGIGDVDGAIGGLSGLLLFLTPFVGLYLGSDAGRFDRRVFSATRPLSDGALAAAVLKNVAAVLCSCSTVWLLGIVVALAIFGPDARQWLQLEHNWRGDPMSFVQMYAGPTILHLLGLCCYLLGVWTAVGLGAALAMTRSWFVGVGGCGSVALMVGLFLSLYKKGDFLLVLPTVCLAGTLASFVAAYRLRVISSRMIITCAAVYILLCIVTVSVFSQLRVANPLDIWNQFILAGICAAPFSPLAAAPWALSWNRHR